MVTYRNGKLVSPTTTVGNVPRGVTRISTSRLTSKNRGGLSLTCPHRDARPSSLKKSITPSSITRMTGLITGEAGAAFNASIYRYKGQLLLAYRTGWRGANIHIARLTEDLKVINNTTLKLWHYRANYGREDPKLWEHNGSLWCSYIGVRGERGRINTHQLLARLSDNLTVEEIIYPHYEHRQSWEKCHMPFSYGGKLWCIYTVHPHRVFEVQRDTYVPTYHENWSPKWSGGMMRGGSPPVRVGDEYICWFHGKFEGGRISYSMGVYSFSVEPPFKPLRLTREPVCIADESTKPKNQYCSVIYPGSSILEDGVWTVPCGIHDRETHVYKYSHEDIDKLLEPV